MKALDHDELEAARALARTALYGFDRLLSSQPPLEPLPAGEVSALVRVIRDKLEPRRVANGRRR